MFRIAIGMLVVFVGLGIGLAGGYYWKSNPSAQVTSNEPTKRADTTVIKRSAERDAGNPNIPANKDAIPKHRRFQPQPWADGDSPLAQQAKAAMANGMAALISEMPDVLNKELPASSMSRFRNLTGGTFSGDLAEFGFSNLGYMICGQINSPDGHDNSDSKWREFVIIRFPLLPIASARPTHAWFDNGNENSASRLCTPDYLGIAWRWRGQAFLKSVIAPVAPYKTESESPPPLSPGNATNSEPKPSVGSSVMDLATSQTLAKENLQSILKDPDGAKYQNVFAYEKTIDGKTFFAFCGALNGRNSFGAFEGNERFIATPVLSALKSTASDFGQAWQLLCSGPGQGPIWF